MYDNEVFSEITVIAKNRMTAKYIISVEDNDNILTEVTAVSSKNENVPTEILISVLDDFIVNSEIDIAYRGNSDVLVEIQPIGFSGVETVIYVREHNRMTGIYELQEPPRITTILNPIKDSFTYSKSEFQRMNYGDSSSLNSGFTQDSILQSYLQFDFSGLSKTFVIINSTLRLYYLNNISKDIDIGISLVNNYWSELGITYLSQPTSSKIDIESFNVNYDEKYVDIELTQVVIDWINANIENNGIMIQFTDLQDNTNYINFKSKESSQPPELYVTYYDSKIYSTGRSQVPTEIFIYQVGDNDILTEIEVHSVIGENIVPIEIEVHLYEVPVYKEVLTELIVSKPLVASEITVSLKDTSIVYTEVQVALELENSILTEISISRPEVLTEVEVKYNNNILTEIEAVQPYTSDMLTEISVNRDIINVEIEVKYNNNILTEIEIEQLNISKVLTEISINRDVIYTEIEVKHNNNILTEIEVEQLNNSKVLTEISVNRDIIGVEIEVKYNNNILTEIEIEQLNTSNISTEISINRDVIDTEIEVNQLNNLDIPTIITISVIKDNDINTEISASRDQILTEIEVFNYHFIETEISVNRPEILTEINVPYSIDEEMLTEIEIRVTRINEIETIITVGKNNPSYVFII